VEEEHPDQRSAWPHQQPSAAQTKEEEMVRCALMADVVQEKEPK
jgi:hypothetical protein